MMIPVILQPEPENFDKDVRQPGMEFLRENSHPSHDREWNNKKHWQKILPRMRDVYCGICAYSGLYICGAMGAESVDHFIPKSQNPELAYEWDNFRYSSRTFNVRKGLNTVLDPFKIGCDWFWILFPSFKVIPNPELSKDIKDAVEQTIKIFKWNEDKGLQEHCIGYIKDYCAGEISLKHLEKKTPFIAFQLKYRGLEEKIKTMMNFSKGKEEG